MFDRFTQLMLACACLAVTFGMMNITLASENSEFIDRNAIKCEVTSELLNRWLISDGTPRYIHLEIGAGSFIDSADDFFCSNGRHGNDCAFPANREGSQFPPHRCNLEAPGIIDTQNPNSYTERHDLHADEQLLSLAINNVMVSNDGNQVKLLVSRHLNRTASEPGFLVYSSTIIAKKSSRGWSFYE